MASPSGRRARPDGAGDDCFPAALRAARHRDIPGRTGDHTRCADAKARKNYPGTSPITRQSGKKNTVITQHVHNDQLIDDLGLPAYAALNASPGARAY